MGRHKKTCECMKCRPELWTEERLAEVRKGKEAVIREDAKAKLKEAASF